MGQLEISGFNLERMTLYYGVGKDADWMTNPKIPASFPGNSEGGTNLALIADVHDLGQPIAADVQTMDLGVLSIEEAPPLQEQMTRLVSTFLDNACASHRSNRANQAIHALVRKSLVTPILPWLPPAETPRTSWRNLPCYPLRSCLDSGSR